MIAELYILPESFLHNNIYPTSQIEDKIKRLSIDITAIQKYKASNRVFANFTSIYPVTFHSTFTLEDFLCRPTDVRKSVDRDVVAAVQNVFQRVEYTSITSKEVIEVLLEEHNKDVCHGLIAFHKVEGVPDNVQLIYGINNWHAFKRHFLGLYPSSENFIDECSIYFPNLFFHERNRETILEILDNFSISIIKHLAVLNDVFFTYKERNFQNETIKYQTLTSECNLEADAAPKDNLDNKKELTFSFLNDNNIVENVVCYPHLRLCRSDKVGDSKYYQHRIYFNEGLQSIQGGKKILIGHIGLHL